MAQPKPKNLFGDQQIPERYIPQKGERIDHFLVEQALGEGSFGTVFKVTDPNRDVFALKLLKLWAIPYEHERKGLLQRFELEYQTGLIESDYLVATRNYGRAKGNPYILMEFCPNGDLRSKMKKSLDSTFIHQAGLEILKGLKALHDNGKIHRDLKPDNVLIDRSGRCKLTDFGIAGHTNIRMTKVNILGKPQEVFGTYAYMPPEQLNPRDTAKLPATDIFSFGVCMYEMFTNEYPFGPLSEESHLGEYAMRAKQGKWEDISRLRSDISPEWKEVIYKSLQPDIKKRFQKTNEILSILGSGSGIYPVRSFASHEDIGLKVMQGEEYGRIYNLKQLLGNKTTGLVRIGRKNDEYVNEMEIQEEYSVYISRKHATLEKTETNDNTWYIKDGQWDASSKQWKGSLNGTFIDSKQLAAGEWIALKPDNIITIGDTTLKVIPV